jgi:hypothetical protein
MTPLIHPYYTLITLLLHPFTPLIYLYYTHTLISPLFHSSIRLNEVDNEDADLSDAILNPCYTFITPTPLYLHCFSIRLNEVDNEDADLSDAMIRGKKP